MMLKKKVNPTIKELMKKPALWMNYSSLKISLPKGGILTSNDWDDGAWQESIFSLWELKEECEFICFLD